jgi:altronate hydrolase
MDKILKINPADNLIVALQDLVASQKIDVRGEEIQLYENIPVKHKFSIVDLNKEEAVRLGVTIGKAITPIYKGRLIRVENIKHASDRYNITKTATRWIAPDNNSFQGKTFTGYRTTHGKVEIRGRYL